MLRWFLILALLPFLAACDSADPEPEPLPSITHVEIEVQGLSPDGAPLGPSQTVRYVLRDGLFGAEPVGDRFVFVERRRYEGAIRFFGEINGEEVDVMSTLRQNRDRIEITYSPTSAVQNAIFFDRSEDLDGNGRPVGMTFIAEAQNVSTTREGLVRVQFVQYRNAEDKRTGAAPIASLPTVLAPIAVLDVEGN